MNKFGKQPKGNEMRETIQSIMEFQSKKYQDIEFSLALDIFQESVENYKRATKRQKLDCVAKVFINACLVMSVEYLTGAQAMEVFNNIATDYGADKDTLELRINKLIKKQRKEYEKNNDNRTWLNLIRMCKRTSNQ